MPRVQWITKTMSLGETRMYRAKHQAGYTLIELLLSVVILSVLLTSVVTFFGVATEARVKNQTVTEVNEQGTAAMDYITQTIRNATSISAPAAGGSVATSLTLVVPTGTLSPTIFSLTGATLQVKEGTAAAIALTGNDIQISNLSFKNLTRPDTNGIVQVSFLASHVNPTNRSTFDYQKTFTSSAEVGL